MVAEKAKRETRRSLGPNICYKSLLSMTFLLDSPPKVSSTPNSSMGW
jgi:hypothetical protein